MHLSLFHINVSSIIAVTYSTYFLLYQPYRTIYPSFFLIRLLRSSPPPGATLSRPVGHVAPFLRAFSTEEAWCTLSSASLSLVTHESFLFLTPTPDRTQPEYPYPAPACFLLSRRWSFFSAPVCCRSPPPSLSTLISPLISLSLSLHALPTTPLRTYANAAAVIVGTATRARILLLVFFPRENVCVRMGERARAATHTKGTLLRTMRYVHARARARDSSLVRATVYRSCAVQRELRKGGGGVLRVNSIPRVALQVPFDTQAWLVLPFLSWNICIF